MTNKELVMLLLQQPEDADVFICNSLIINKPLPDIRAIQPDGVFLLTNEDSPYYHSIIIHTP